MKRQIKKAMYFANPQWSKSYLPKESTHRFFAKLKSMVSFMR